MCGIAAVVALPGWRGELHGAPPGVAEALGLTSGGGDGVYGEVDAESSHPRLDSLPDIDQLADAIRSRGPDGCRVLPAGRVHPNVALAASTLRLRGGGGGECEESAQSTQPLIDAQGNALIFNGEIFNDGTLEDSPPDDLIVTERQHDGEVLLQRLHDEWQRRPNSDVVSRVLARLIGPYALIYWQRCTQRLYFAKDALGRRSLLLCARGGEGVALSSSCGGVGAVERWRELPPFGLYSLQLTAAAAVLSLHPHAASGGAGALCTLSAAPPPLGAPPAPLAQLCALPRALCRPRLAYAAPRVVTDAQLAAVERSLDSALRAAVRQQVAGIARTDTVAVLFSGGIDSLLLARLLHDALPADVRVELLNVAFGQSQEPPEDCADRVSARTALSELLACVGGGAGGAAREWSFVRIDVDPSRRDDAAECARIAAQLLPPASSPMDVSIGTALCFAARGVGSSSDASAAASADTPRAHRSPARVVFSGLGADEQLGGYKRRHRRAFERGGMSALAAELHADVARLWWRNLGRDDRVVGAHGRELRLPFLDERVVAMLAATPLELLCDLRLPDGVGDKRLLRRVAARAGLPASACARIKRAIQFGSRSAKFTA